MSFYSDQGDQYLQLANQIEARLEKEGSTLDKTTLQMLNDQLDTLQNQVDEMRAADVQATLAQLKGVNQPQLAQSTKDLLHAVETIKKFDQASAIVGAAVKLTTAIAEADPGAIATGIVGAEQAVAAATAKAKVVTMPQPKAASGIALAASGEIQERDS